MCFPVSYNENIFTRPEGTERQNSQRLAGCSGLRSSARVCGYKLYSYEL
ncbi:hypothetical protein [Desulfovulcanus sp.]